MRFPGWQIEVNHDNFFWSPETAQCFSSWMFKISVICAKVTELKSLILYWSCENEAEGIEMNGRENTSHRSKIIHLLSGFWIMLNFLSSKDYCHWYWQNLHAIAMLSEFPASFQYPKGIISHHQYLLYLQILSTFQMEGRKLFTYSQLHWILLYSSSSQKIIFSSRHQRFISLKGNKEEQNNYLKYLISVENTFLKQYSTVIASLFPQDNVGLCLCWTCALILAEVTPLALFNYKPWNLLFSCLLLQRMRINFMIYILEHQSF